MDNKNWKIHIENNIPYIQLFDDYNKVLVKRRFLGWDIEYDGFHTYNKPRFELFEYEIVTEDFFGNLYVVDKKNGTLVRDII